MHRLQASPVHRATRGSSTETGANRCEERWQDTAATECCVTCCVTCCRCLSAARRETCKKPRQEDAKTLRQDKQMPAEEEASRQEPGAARLPDRRGRRAARATVCSSALARAPRPAKPASLPPGEPAPCAARAPPSPALSSAPAARAREMVACSEELAFTDDTPRKLGLGGTRARACVSTARCFTLQ